VAASILKSVPSGPSGAPGLWLRFQIWFSRFNDEKSSAVLYFTVFLIFPATLGALDIAFGNGWFIGSFWVLLLSLLVYARLSDWRLRRRARKERSGANKG
jgi:hypothetical protein